VVVKRRFAAHGARFDFLQRVAEVRSVLKTAVHRCEADVTDLVELVELAHHHLADLARRNLPLAEAQHLLDDAFDGLIDVFGRHRALVQRALETVADARHIEVRARAVLLDHLGQAQLGVLVGREALLARHAAPPPADRIPGFRNPGVDDLRIRSAAERAFHDVGVA